METKKTRSIRKKRGELWLERELERAIIAKRYETRLLRLQRRCKHPVIEHGFFGISRCRDCGKQCQATRD